MKSGCRGIDMLIISTGDDFKGILKLASWPIALSTLKVWKMISKEY